MMRSIDVILYHAHIITLDPLKPYATAIAIHNGRILAVGSDDDILPLATPTTRLYHMGGRVVMPGLTDAHIHWQKTAIALQQIAIFEAPSKHHILEQVREQVERLEPGEWVIGHGWSQDFWQVKDFPTASDLDSVAPHHPVYLTGKSYHVAWVNSLAMQQAHLSASTPDPAGGQFVRDEHGVPTGILLEAPAMLQVFRHIPKPSLEQIVRWMQHAQTQAHSYGLTALHDLDDSDCLVALQMMRERAQLGLRVTKYINRPYLHNALESGIRFGFGDDWLRFGGLKLFADGALGPRTALMLEPYEGQPNNYGIRVTDYEEMHELVHLASRAGLPTAIHAIGDRAVREVLNIFEAVREDEAGRGVAPTDLLHRVEHVQLIHPDDLDRFRQLNLIASMQPIHATSDYEAADALWGERALYAYNAREQLQRGVVVAFGSDAPIEPFNPWTGIFAAVTRRRPNGSPSLEGWYPQLRLTLDEALHGYTLGAAQAVGLQDRQGKLSTNYYADLIVLDRNPYTIPHDELLNVQVLSTMVDGHWRWGELLH